MVKFEVTNRFTGKVQLTAEIDCDEGAPRSIKLGLAVKWAIKSGANLADANLVGANLAYADLADANLVGANLAYADLADANLVGANLAYADLADANLARANLADANLARANLVDANLARANLVGANLAYADLARANLADANLADAKNADMAIAKTRILPDGDIIGWKKLCDGIVAKLLIPASAKRSHAFGRKCRAEFAEVLEVTASDGKPAEAGYSQRNSFFEYRAGSTVHPDSWDDNWQDECSHGIHFFITKSEAEAY